jgi:hypothetical protein
MSVFDAKRGDEAVNGSADGIASTPQDSIVVGRSHGERQAAVLKNIQA